MNCINVLYNLISFRQLSIYFLLMSTNICSSNFRIIEISHFTGHIELSLKPVLPYMKTSSKLQYCKNGVQFFNLNFQYNKRLLYMHKFIFKIKKYSALITMSTFIIRVHDKGLTDFTSIIYKLL